MRSLKSVTVYFSLEEYERVREEAEDNGVTVSELVDVVVLLAHRRSKKYLAALLREITVAGPSFASDSGTEGLSEVHPAFGRSSDKVATHLDPGMPSLAIGTPHPSFEGPRRPLLCDRVRHIVSRALVQTLRTVQPVPGSLYITPHAASTASHTCGTPAPAWLMLAVLNCPFLILCANSIPLSVTAALLKLLNPNIGEYRCFTRR